LERISADPDYCAGGYFWCRSLEGLAAWTLATGLQWGTGLGLNGFDLNWTKKLSHSAWQK